MRWLIFLTVISFPAYSGINLDLQNELIVMEAEDQKVRAEVGRAGWDKAPKALLEKLSEIDKRNISKLKKIVEKYSWPTKELVGIGGVAAAFIIIQHSSDIEFNKKMLPFLEEAYKNDDGITGQQLALFTDRLLTAQGKKQVYGTQAKLIEGKIVFYPIDNEKNVDERRKKIDLPELSFYLKILEESYGVKDHPDVDLN